MKKGLRVCRNLRNKVRGVHRAIAVAMAVYGIVCTILLVIYLIGDCSHRFLGIDFLAGLEGWWGTIALVALAIAVPLGLYDAIRVSAERARLVATSLVALFKGKPRARRHKKI